MSWDLYLVPAEHADDAHEWLESLVGQAGGHGATADHAAAVRVRRPELEIFVSAPGPRRRSPRRRLGRLLGRGRAARRPRRLVADIVEALWRMIDASDQPSAQQPRRRRRFFGLFGG